MNEIKVEEALTEWLDDESEHAAADFGARFNSDHPGFDMLEMAMGFYAGYAAASKQIEPVAPEPSCLLCTEHDTCQYQGPEVCGDFVRKIPAPVQLAQSEEDVPRWHHANEGDYCTGMRREDDGEMVKYEDYAALRAQLAERAREGCAEKIGLHYKHCLSDIQQFIYDNDEEPLSSLQPMLDEQRKATLALFVEIHSAFDGKEKAK